MKFIRVLKASNEEFNTIDEEFDSFLSNCEFEDLEYACKLLKLDLKNFGEEFDELLTNKQDIINAISNNAKTHDQKVSIINRIKQNRKKRKMNEPYWDENGHYTLR